MQTTKSTQDAKFQTSVFVCFVLFVISVVLVLISTTTTALAQCAMCKTNIAGAENSAEVSSAINTGVLVLLIPTLAIIGGVVRLIFKYRR